MFKLNLSSIQGKVPIYKGAGSGRDTYVMHDSGGFVKASCADSLMRTGSFVRVPATSRPRNVSIEGKTVIYKSNGGGRDAYIVADSGGFTGRTPRSSSTEGFLGSLRTYERIRVQPAGSKDFFGWAQRTPRGKDIVEEANRRDAVMKVTKRLSSPKTTYNFRVKNSASSSTAAGSLQSLKEKLMSSFTSKLLKSKTNVNISPEPEMRLPREELRLTPVMPSITKGLESPCPSPDQTPTRSFRHKKSNSAVFLGNGKSPQLVPWRNGKGGL